ncbi:MAG: HD domain-containing protein [Saprospiraceae bacterium]|nr:HD domain-containing protein [Saprospiraceae bacterium]
MLTRDQARDILFEMTETASLRRHARTVELVMEALAEHYGEDVEKWAITGMLHDADYEKYPDRHPGMIVERLRAMGEDEIAHAIAGHYTIWNVPRESLMDKAIVAADELTGFVVAAALIRPTKIEGMKAKSVMKKLKTKTFAAKVDRDEVYRGAELLGWDIRELITFIIGVLEQNKEELELV